jgi:hypothetical protein
LRFLLSRLECVLIRIKNPDKYVADNEREFSLLAREGGEHASEGRYFAIQHRSQFWSAARWSAVGMFPMKQDQRRPLLRQKDATKNPRTHDAATRVAGDRVCHLSETAFERSHARSA